MSRTFGLLHKAKLARAAATPAPAPAPKPAPAVAARVEEEVPYIEVGGPDQIEASADVMACPPPTKKLYLHPPAQPTETPPASAKAKEPAPSIISICWNR